ncbi:MAG: RNA methyltransferase [Saprospiraceae bacterium]|nr:RNA methyltransferase [Saprospiraceae bacterium]
MEALEARHAALQKSEPWPVSVVCDDLRSALNVGSIFRTGDAFRIAHVWLCGISAQPPHREILKTALGATDTVPWSYRKDVGELIMELQAKGIQCIGLEQTTGSKPLQKWVWDGQTPMAVVVGNEVHGVSDEILDQLDGYMEIPQFGSKHSLNVAVATGIALWELIRQQLV